MTRLLTWLFTRDEATRLRLIAARDEAERHGHRAKRLPNRPTGDSGAVASPAPYGHLLKKAGLSEDEIARLLRG